MKKKLFLGVYNPSIVLTYISVFSALIGMAMLLTAKPWESINETTIAMICLMISGICDMFDGAVARKCKRTEIEKEFGVQLDSLADTFAFVAYPAAILIFETGSNWYTMAIAFLYAFAGIMRLGWFNVTTEDNKGTYFGLPVTTASFIFPFLHAIALVFDIHWIAADILMHITFLVVGILFIANFKMKKPGIVFKAVASLLAIGTIVTLLIA
jgi:CDP-diacylglycerol--serine O-phosphatidyltransferase